MANIQSFIYVNLSVAYKNIATLRRKIKNWHLRKITGMHNKLEVKFPLQMSNESKTRLNLCYLYEWKSFLWNRKQLWKTDLNPTPNHNNFRCSFYVLHVLCIAYAFLCNKVIYCQIQYRTYQVSKAPAQEGSIRFKSISYHLLCRSNYMSPTLKAFP